MDRSSAASISVVRRLTGTDLGATRRFLLKECFVPGHGFSSQYGGQLTVSCTTTAICAYSLSEAGLLTARQKIEFQRVLLAFRLTDPPNQAGAFPRTTGGAPTAWTTGQAVIALLSLGAPWIDIRPSVDWLLKTQGSNGGWNFPGTNEGHERLIYTFYPTLVLLRCRRRFGSVAKQALARVAGFIDSCEEHKLAFWGPLRGTRTATCRNTPEARRHNGSRNARRLWRTVRQRVADNACR